MHIMAGLLADFIIEAHAYANANLDDFAWTGMDVRPFDGTGKPLGWKYTYNSKKLALETKDELLEKYPQVAIRDNATRKEKIFRQVDKTDLAVKERRGPRMIRSGMGGTSR